MKRFLLCAIFIIMIIMPSLTPAEFIVNETISTRELRHEEIVQIFLFYVKICPRDGTKITVILPPPMSYLFKKLATDELKMGATNYYDSVKLKIANGSASPVFAASEAEVLIKVANTPHSIGYYHDSIRINDGFGVKTITIK